MRPVALRIPGNPYNGRRDDPVPTTQPVPAGANREGSMIERSLKAARRVPIDQS